jgi:cytochrome b subunit of formate dehydrogenase
MGVISFFSDRIIQWFEEFEEYVYKKLARGNRTIGLILNTVGICFGGLIILALITGGISSILNGKVIFNLSSIVFAIGVTAIAFFMAFTFFMVGVFCSYSIVVIIRCILHPIQEYNRFIEFSNKFSEDYGRRRRNQLLREGRCPNCGIKSTYTRVDGSQRCSKCGWDSRYE